MSPHAHPILARALYKMLRPLVRLLLRYGVSYRLFADMARYVYVEVASEDFEIPGRKSSHSRVAILTGINRKDIAKLKERPHPLEDHVERRSASARLIDAWINDNRFHDSHGRPLTLPMDGTTPHFAELVALHCCDVPVRAMLDELVRLGAVELMAQGVRLKVPGYVPYTDVEEQIRILSTAVADLLSTLDRNVARDPRGAYIQRTVSYDNIPVELLERIRNRSRTEGDAFLLQINDWLAQMDREYNSELVGSGRARAGIGIYYFEHQHKDGGE